MAKSNDKSRFFALVAALVILLVAVAVLAVVFFSNRSVSQAEDAKLYAEVDRTPCPPRTNRVQDIDGSYPTFYCVGFDGKQGPLLEFDVHGRMRLSANYDKDMLNGEWTSYHANGGIDTKGVMEDDMRQGQWTQYYVNGNKRSLKTYKDNVQNGDFELYYQTGGLMAKGSFVDDLEQGLWKVYTPEGKCARECTMVDGKETNCQIFIKDYQITTKSYNSSNFGAL